VWSAYELRDKLQPYRHLAQRYFPSVEWVNNICGSTGLSPSGFRLRVTPTEALLCSKLDVVSETLSSQTESELLAAKEALQEGRSHDASLFFRRATNPQLWDLLAPETQARVLRFGARLALFTGDLIQAEDLARRAQGLSPAEQDLQLDAWLAFEEGEVSFALESLKELDDASSRNLRAIMLINLDRLDEALEIVDDLLSRDEGDAEALRLRALINLARGRFPLADLDARKALEAAPKWEATRFVAAMVDYLSSLSPAIVLPGVPYWPQPVDWMLVRRDSDTLIRLRRAASVFEALIEQSQDRPKDRRRYECWCLACLLNDHERQEEGTRYLADLLKKEPTQVGPIFWAITRRIRVDLEPSIALLENAVSHGTPEPREVLVLVAHYISTKNHERPLELLDQFHSLFSEAGLENQWVSAKADVLVLANPTEALDFIDTHAAQWELSHLRTAALAVISGETEDNRQLFEHLERCYSQTNDAIHLLNACQVAVRNESWDYVSDRAERLVEEIRTAESLYLAATLRAGDLAPVSLAMIKSPRMATKSAQLWPTE